MSRPVGDVGWTAGGHDGRHAKRAEVTASAENGILHVVVSDDGLGGAVPEGTGLVSLDDRVAAAGGRLRVDSPKGGGTRVTADLPLPV
jgi:signal transduction histidine kinase